MAVLRYVAPALAAAGYVAAATCSASTTTISNPSDATGLASCRTFTGTIAIATDAADSIALDGIETITGSLIVNNVSQLTALSGDSLMSIQDTFNLQDLTILSSLNFPMLSSAQTVLWQALNRLQTVSTPLDEVSSLTISDTQLSSLEGINLETADNVQINNNNYLKTISLQLANVTTDLDISFNGEMVQVSLPNLMTVGNMTIRNASTVSIPSLAKANGSIGFYSSAFQSLSAPNLTSVDGTLAIDLNDALTNASFPLLKTLTGGLQIQNNTALKSIDGFPSLSQVVGAVDIYGNFSNVSLPDITSVRGDFNLQSSEDLTEVCAFYKKMAGSGNTIQGTFTCAGGLNNPNTTGTLSSGTSIGNDTTASGSSASTTSKSAAHPLLIPGATGLLGVVAACFGML